MISAWIIKADEGSHLSSGGVVGGAGLHAIAKMFKCCRCLLQAVFVFDLKPDGLIFGIAFRVTKRVRSVVPSQIKRFLAALGDLQSQAARRKCFSRFQIWRSQANI